MSSDSGVQPNPTDTDSNPRAVININALPVTAGSQRQIQQLLNNNLFLNQRIFNSNVLLYSTLLSMNNSNNGIVQPNINLVVDFQAIKNGGLPFRCPYGCAQVDVWREWKKHWYNEHDAQYKEAQLMQLTQLTQQTQETQMQTQAPVQQMLQTSAAAVVAVAQQQQHSLKRRFFGSNANQQQSTLNHDTGLQCPSTKRQKCSPMACHGMNAASNANANVNANVNPNVNGLSAGANIIPNNKQIRSASASSSSNSSVSSFKTNSKSKSKTKTNTKTKSNSKAEADANATPKTGVKSNPNANSKSSSKSKVSAKKEKKMKRKNNENRRRGSSVHRDTTHI